MRRERIIRRLFKWAALLGVCHCLSFPIESSGDEESNVYWILIGNDDYSGVKGDLPHVDLPVCVADGLLLKQRLEELEKEGRFKGKIYLMVKQGKESVKIPGGLP